jgi:hypothetical protein
MPTATGELQWWSRELEATLEAPTQFTVSPSFRLLIGDLCLEVIADHQPLLDDLEALYGDCTARPRPESGASFVSCSAARMPRSDLLHLSFQGQELPDPIDVAKSLFRPLKHRQCYVERQCSVDGWRFMVNADAGDTLLLASRGRVAVLNLAEAPPEFLIDCLITAVQSVQPGILFVHGASIAVTGSGALLIGNGRAGKSTTSLAVASIGHSFLGDDAAAVRIATRELLPFPKSAGVRDEALAGSLGWPLHECRHTIEVSPNGSTRTIVRVGDLFPRSVSGPVPLRFAFFLDGFADQTTIRPFKPRLNELSRLKCLTGEMTASWGTSVGRHLMKFLTAVDLLSGLQCHLVELGPPMETAYMIAEVMEEACT